MTIKNDITELAQSLKAAAEKAGIEQWVNNRGEVNTADYEVDGGVYIDHICNCEIAGTESPRAEFIALANPANILALVEALEKAQQHETQASEMAVQLSSRLTSANKRIAELESRTVKLPADNAAESESPENDASAWFDEGWNARGKANKEALTAAGIKVEGG
ncbi:TPA: ead/Ea22-like family protein [Klebsiella pneumoniae]|nr:ead/Ea22-like family protein [Klebsiella pneumoniae]